MTKKLWEDFDPLTFLIRCPHDLPHQMVSSCLVLLLSVTTEQYLSEVRRTSIQENFLESWVIIAPKQVDHHFGSSPKVKGWVLKFKVLSEGSG
jgi:hypothetical protein